MRSLVVPLCLLAAGCGGVEVRDTPGPTPPDLRTRKTGSHWPCFLGPTVATASSERGILAPCPEKGLRLVWQKPLGQGYAMPTISRGRLFHFDRHGNTARLTCRKSETGEELWKFEYPTHYSDRY